MAWTLRVPSSRVMGDGGEDEDARDTLREGSESSIDSLEDFFKLRESMLPINSGLCLLTVIILTYLHVCTICFSQGKVKMKELKKIFISQKRNLFFIYFSTLLTKSSCPI